MPTVARQSVNSKGQRSAAGEVGRLTLEAIAKQTLVDQADARGVERREGVGGEGDGGRQ